MLKVTGLLGVRLDAAPAFVENRQSSKASVTITVIAREDDLKIMRPLQVGLVLIALN
jgi:hypothetical protein